MDKKKILIIDDDEALGKTLKMSLENIGGYEVSVETSGSKGLIAAKKYKPDLILLDVMFPDMDGGEIASQIKSDNAVKDTPIVFLTAAVTKEEIGKQCNIIGGHPFIAKPVSVEDIAKYINKFI